MARVAGALRALGVVKGDRVLIFMPNTPEAVMTMLASARLGAVHSVVFGGFASPELAARIDDAQPKVIVWASCGIEPGRIVAYKPLLDGALALASHKPDACLVLQRSTQAAGASSLAAISTGTAAVGDAEPVEECVPVLATDPLYILYTSGTTGKPKGVVHDNGGYAVALTWSMRNIYGAEPGDVYWAASDLGWAVGHSYIVYGPLLARLHDSPVRRQAGRHAGRRRILARDLATRRERFCSPRPPPSGPSSAPTPGESSSGATTSARSARCSSPASAPIPTRSSGPSGGSAFQSSITGGRPKPAGRSVQIPSGWRNNR